MNSCGGGKQATGKIIAAKHSLGTVLRRDGTFWASSEFLESSPVLSVNVARVLDSSDFASSPCCLSPSLRQLSDHQRPHHVVFLVLQDVAVPHVLVAASPRARRSRHDHTTRCDNTLAR